MCGSSSAPWYVLPGLVLALAGADASLAVASFPRSISVLSLNGSNGYVLNGIDQLDRSGAAVAWTDDCNGDQFGDMIIAAPQAAEVYIVFGGPSVAPSGALALASLNGANGLTITGVNPADDTGESVASIPDLNGDDISDIVIGAYDASPGGRSGAGAAYVVFGRNTTSGASFPATLPLASLDGTNGFTVPGIDPFDRCGHTVAHAGDLNGDGWPDLLVCAEYADPLGRTNAGELYVIFGGPGVGASGAIDPASLDGTNGFTILGAEPGDRAGHAAAGAQDINGDGIDDLAIGAPFADTLGGNNAGKVFVLFGGPDVGASGVIDLSNLDGVNGFVLHGIDAFDRCGARIAEIADLNGDAIPDLCFSAPYAASSGNFETGEVSIVFGRDTATTGNFPAVMDLRGLSANLGAVIRGNWDSQRIGGSLATVPDASWDGIAEILIGAPMWGPFSNGEAYVLFGSRFLDTLPTTNPALIDGVNGFTITGANPNDRLADAVAVGDVNGDSILDYILGAPSADPSGQPFLYRGRTFVILGTPPRCIGDVNGDLSTSAEDFAILAAHFGQGPGATVADGDLNEDGHVRADDFVMLAGNYGCPRN